MTNTSVICPQLKDRHVWQRRREVGPFPIALAVGSLLGGTRGDDPH